MIWVPCVIEVPHGVFLLFVAGSKCVLAGTMAQSIAICAGDSNFKAGYKIKQIQGPLLIYSCIHMQSLHCLYFGIKEVIYVKPANVG